MCLQFFFSFKTILTLYIYFLVNFVKMTVKADIPRAVTDVYRLRAIKQPRYKGPAIFSGMRRRFTLAVPVSGSGSTREGWQGLYVVDSSPPPTRFYVEWLKVGEGRNTLFTDATLPFANVVYCSYCCGNFKKKSIF